MDRELRERWVAALRSGKYEQGAGCLRTKEDKFCCLGVLCDLVDNSLWGEITSYDIYKFDGVEYDLPNVGIIGGDPEVQTALICLNDGEESETNPKAKAHSFNEIADWIEANL